MNRAEADEQGRIFHRPVDPPDEETSPSVYVFLHLDIDETVAYELASLEALRGIAERPFRQQATALPFYQFGSYQSPSLSQRMMITPGGTPRWPTAVIDVGFEHAEFAVARPDLTASWLLPQDDPVYRRLVEIGAPEVTRYRAADGSPPEPIGSLAPLRPRDPEATPIGAPGIASSEVLRAGTEMLGAAGVQCSGSSMTWESVEFFLDREQLALVSQELRDKLRALGRERGIDVAFLVPADDEE